MNFNDTPQRPADRANHTMGKLFDVFSLCVSGIMSKIVSRARASARVPVAGRAPAPAAGRAAGRSCMVRPVSPIMAAFVLGWLLPSGAFAGVGISFVPAIPTTTVPPAQPAFALTLSPETNTDANGNQQLDYIHYYTINSVGYATQSYTIWAQSNFNASWSDFRGKLGAGTYLYQVSVYGYDLEPYDNGWVDGYWEDEHDNPDDPGEVTGSHWVDTYYDAGFNWNYGLLGNATIQFNLKATPPVITSVASAAGTATSPFSYTITGTNNPSSYSVAGVLPTGLKVNSANGVISGTPSQTGAFNVTIQATNGSGTGSLPFALTVNAATAPSFVVQPAHQLLASGASGATLVAGLGHSLALKQDGTISAWGWNGYGQLGDGTLHDRYTAAPVAGLTDVLALASGYGHSLAVKNDGTVWAWGCDYNGQLGLGTTGYRATPTNVGGLSGVVAVAAGSVHSVALKSDGTVWAWGYNVYGMVGDGSTTDRLTPVQVGGLTGVVAVSAGTYHSLAQKADGSVWAWGWSGFGALGDGTAITRTLPVQVVNLSGASGIAGGFFRSLARTNDGAVRAWGYGAYGALGNGTETNTMVPVSVTNLTGVDAIATHDFGWHSLARKSDGSVWTWGYNSSGQLGIGTTVNQSVPVLVNGLSDVAVVATGSAHSLVTKRNGTVWSWGRNSWAGELGDGTRVDRSTPVQVTGLTGVAVPGSANVAFTVIASGSPAPTYQWQRKAVGQPAFTNLVNSSTFSGATSASLGVLGASAAMEGDQFRVVVTNAVGSTTSNAARLTRLPNGPTATHTIVSGGGNPGGTITIRSTINFAGVAGVLGWKVVVPAGWSYASGTGEGSIKPRVGATKVLEWAWSNPLTGPVVFTYTLAIPAGASGSGLLYGSAIVRQTDLFATVAATSDPLVVGTAPAAAALVPRLLSSTARLATPTHYRADRHSADTDEDLKIGLIELTRVIQLYHVRTGTVRTGRYRHIQLPGDPDSEDGFVPEYSSTLAPPPSEAPRHSADINRNNQLSLFELLRVIELYNYYVDTTRTGDYHVRAGTEDGFATGKPTPKPTPVLTYLDRTFLNRTIVYLNAAYDLTDPDKINVLTATLAGMAGLPPPTGAIIYNVVKSHPDNRISGSPVGHYLTPAYSPITIRASYPGDANYAPIFVDAVYTDKVEYTPTPPADVRPVLVGPTSLSVSWLACGNIPTGISPNFEFDISKDRGASVARTVTGGVLSAVINDLTPNTTYAVLVRGRDQFGNVSAWSDLAALTTSASGAAPSAPSRWIDLNDDGLADEITDAGSTWFDHVITAESSVPVTYTQWVKDWSYIPSYTYTTGRYSDGYGQTYYVPGDWVTEWSDEDVTVDIPVVLPEFSFVADPGYDYRVGRLTRRTNGVYIFGEIFSLDHGDTIDGINTWTPSDFWSETRYYGLPFVLVRNSFAPGGCVLTLPGMGAITANKSAGTVKLGNGTTITVGPAGATVTIPGAGTVTISTNGNVTTSLDGNALPSGVTHTTGVPSIGLPDGITVNPGTGEVTVAGPAGSSVTVGGAGGLRVALPPGLASIAGIIGEAVDTVGKILGMGTDPNKTKVDNGDGVWRDLDSGELGNVVETGTQTVRVGATDSDTREPKSQNIFTITFSRTQLPVHRLAVDANRDGTITFDAADATSRIAPYRFWLNDDDENLDSVPDANDVVVNGAKDLEDFFPVFLDIQQLVKVLPPSASVKYKLKQADGAVNFVETNLPRASAFSYQSGSLTTGFGAALGQAASSATTTRVTAAGVELSAQFLNNVRDNNQGVILVEGRTPSTAPLVLTLEKDGVQIAEVSLSLSLGARILLLLHGMNSNINTWNAYVTASFGGSSAIIRDRAIIGQAPNPSAYGVRCYRVQFGAYDGASTRVGLEGVTAANTPGYLLDPLLRCGDFETFETLGRELDDAIALLLAAHPNAQIVLLGHSRGGLAARAFLQSPGATPTKAAVIGLLTTSSPHLGSRMGRIYGWLNTHRRNEPGTDSDDWDVVDFLRSPTVPVIGTPKDAIDVRRPIILDVADNSLAIAGPAGLNAGVGNLPAGIRYGEIVYDRARFGLMTLTPVRYTVFDGPGGNPFDQLSDAATTFLCNGGTPDDLQFRGDGLIPAGYQRFTQLSGFTGTAIAPLTVTAREVVHTGAPSQTDDLRLQLRVLYPDWWPSP